MSDGGKPSLTEGALVEGDAKFLQEKRAVNQVEAPSSCARSIASFRESLADDLVSVADRLTS